MSGQDGLGRGEQAGSDFAPGSDDEVRAIFVRLITFVVAAKLSLVLAAFGPENAG